MNGKMIIQPYPDTLYTHPNTLYIDNEQEEAFDFEVLVAENVKNRKIA